MFSSVVIQLSKPPFRAVRALDPGLAVWQLPDEAGGESNVSAATGFAPVLANRGGWGRGVAAGPGSSHEVSVRWKVTPGSAKSGKINRPERYGHNRT